MPESVVNAVTAVPVDACLVLVGVIIGGHIDVAFLRQRGKGLATWWLCSATAVLVLVAGGVHAMYRVTGLAVAVAAIALERSSGEAIAGITEARALAPDAPVGLRAFAQGVLMTAAVMDVAGLVAFMVVGSVVFHGDFWSLIPTFFSIALFVAAAEAATIGALTLHHVMPSVGRLLPSWRATPVPLQRAWICAAAPIVGILGTYWTIGPAHSELLPAGIIVGAMMRAKGTRVAGPDVAATPDVSVDTTLSPAHGGVGAAAAIESPTALVESRDVWVYLVLFTLTGLRLRAVRLLQPSILASGLVISLLRLAALTGGGWLGCRWGGLPHGRVRGIALVTQVAVAFALLHRTETYVRGNPVALAVVDAARASSLVNLLAGPPLLQFALRYVAAAESL
jgi:hypothetical protein